jgi:phenylpyruvate tautomerase PptA (4-oxalocrotonate tautomerase family)
MPAIADQVATIEQDLQEALAKVDSLTAEKEALAKSLTALIVEKSDLEAKYDDQQSVVDQTRELADKLANMALTMLRESRRQVAAPQLKASDSTSEGAGTPSELTAQTDAAAQPRPDFTGQSTGLKRVSPSEGTAADRLRAHLLLETAAGALERRSPRVKLPDGMPMFLQQPMSPPLGTRRARVME